MGYTQRRTPTLVTGGTGKTGRRVVERLTARGARAGWVAFRRTAVRLGRPVDLGARDAGRRLAYITYYPDLAIPGAADAVGSLADVAREQGVPGGWSVSGRGEQEAQRAERALQETDADWTILTCAWFMQNFDESFMLEPIQAARLCCRRGRARAVRRRRRHRRRRRRGAHRRPSHRPALPADSHGSSASGQRSTRSQMPPAGRSTTCRYRPRKTRP